MAIYDLSSEFDQNKANKYFNMLVKNKALINLEIKKHKHSNPQRKYFHALIKIFSIETGYSFDESKIIAKRQSDFMVYAKNGTKFLRSSSTLDSAEYTQMIENFRNHASKDAGVYLPSPEEFESQLPQIESYISRNKFY